MMVPTLFGLGASTKLVHQSKDAFPNLKQLLPRLRNHRLWQKLLRRDGFQSVLRLVQMVQRAFQARDGERGVTKSRTAGDAIQGSGQFCAGSLELEDELPQILVGRFIQTQFVSLAPELYRAFKTAMLQRVAQIAALGANPVNAFAVRIRLGWRLVRRGFANRIDLLDGPSFLLKLLLGLVFPHP